MKMRGLRLLRVRVDRKSNRSSLLCIVRICGCNVSGIIISGVCMQCVLYKRTSSTTAYAHQATNVIALGITLGITLPVIPTRATISSNLLKSPIWIEISDFPASSITSQTTSSISQ